MISGPSNFSHITHMGPCEGIEFQQLIDLNQASKKSSGGGIAAVNASKADRMKQPIADSVSYTSQNMTNRPSSLHSKSSESSSLEKDGFQQSTGSDLPNLSDVSSGSRTTTSVNRWAHLTSSMCPCAERSAAHLPRCALQTRKRCRYDAMRRLLLSDCTLLPDLDCLSSKIRLCQVKDITSRDVVVESRTAETAQRSVRPVRACWRSPIVVTGVLQEEAAEAEQNVI
ncbi:unnamed protein product [Soboliphyme baturini]|uniref:CRIB domain-containing protein n=1 Tax=Soboliphyme baturini TaxID=241478 RepID=A0A183IMN8_9BILA|nr:unnamed protein product [Soboliphyme baturini]